MEKVKRRDSLFIDLISDALEELMLEKPFSQITISELTAKAGISRITFYRNFDDKEDVLRKRVSKHTAEWMKQESIEPSFLKNDEEFYAFSLKLFQFWFDNQNSIRLLANHGLTHILENETEIKLKEILKDESNIYHVDFIIGGLFRVLKYWAINGCKDSPEDVVKSIRQEVFPVSKNNLEEK